MPKNKNDKGKVSVLDSDGQPLGSLANVENGKDSGIVCDFSEIPRRWSMTMTRMYADVLKAQVVMHSKLKKDADLQDEYQFIQEAAIAADVISTSDVDFESLLAEVVVSVDRKWLTKKAPDNLDWSVPESFRWIRDIVHLEFVSKVMEQRAELTKQAKN